MNEARVSFRSGRLLLEGAESAPPGTGPFPAVLVCHPHPSFGGSMDNDVVRSVCEALFEKSIMTLRFNFRGVGKSEGRFGHGIGEQDDVEAAISFLIAEKNKRTLVVSASQATQRAPCLAFPLLSGTQECERWRRFHSPWA